MVTHGVPTQVLGGGPDAAHAGAPEAHAGGQGRGRVHLRGVKGVIRGWVVKGQQGSHRDSYVKAESDPCNTRTHYAAIYITHKPNIDLNSKSLYVIA